MILFKISCVGLLNFSEIANVCVHVDNNSILNKMVRKSLGIFEWPSNITLKRKTGFLTGFKIRFSQLELFFLDTREAKIDTPKAIIFCIQLALSNSNLYYLNLFYNSNEFKVTAIYFLQIESLCNSNKTFSPLEFELARFNCNI